MGSYSRESYKGMSISSSFIGLDIVYSSWIFSSIEESIISLLNKR